MRNTDRITYNKIIVDHETGEITETEIVHKQGVEPSFVKLYLDCIFQFKGLSTSLNPILLGFLKRMSYASPELLEGGQIIYVNAQMKRDIAKEVGKSVKRVEQALTDFVKTEIFKRIATGTYQVNPYIFGRGEWKDIKNIRTTLDFAAGTIDTKIEKIEKVEEEPQIEGQIAL